LVAIIALLVLSEGLIAQFTEEDYLLVGECDTTKRGRLDHWEAFFIEGSRGRGVLLGLLLSLDGFPF
jgi:hypothetical protein